MEARPASAPTLKQQKKQPPGEVMRATYAFTAQDDSQLSFRQGSSVKILEKGEAGDWWRASVDGQEGWIPSSYLEEPVEEASATEKPPPMLSRQASRLTPPVLSRQASRLTASSWRYFHRPRGSQSEDDWEAYDEKTNRLIADAQSGGAPWVKLNEKFVEVRFGPAATCDKLDDPLEVPPSTGIIQVNILSQDIRIVRRIPPVTYMPAAPPDAFSSSSAAFGAPPAAAAEDSIASSTASSAAPPPLQRALSSSSIAKGVKAARELLSTERTYVSNLGVVLEVFATPLRAWADEAGSGSSSAEIDGLFAGVGPLRALNKSLLAKLDAEAAKPEAEAHAAGVMLRFAPSLAQHEEHGQSGVLAWP